jgi:precorrin-6B methylase 2
MGELTDAYVRIVRRQVAGLSEHPTPPDLEEILRTISRWRSHVLKNTFLVHHGPNILAGPFAGMDYVSEAAEGALLPRLLGSYESELHPHLSAFCDEGVDCVIDVGCAEGYYAVGLARMLSDATVYAYDIDPKARAACATLAARNQVSDRVVIGEHFGPTDFEAFAGRQALVIMDVEGAETDLLRPDLSPALSGMGLIVETHGPKITATLLERFAATHEITRVDIGPKTVDLPAWLDDLAHLDQLLAVWEWRRGPTPWLVMRPKAA